jgi:hypothetical protein
MAKAPTEIRSLARSHTDTAIRTLAGIMRQNKAPASARVAAAQALLDRGWGKPAQPQTGEDGTGPIVVRWKIDETRPEDSTDNRPTNGKDHNGSGNGVHPVGGRSN